MYFVQFFTLSAGTDQAIPPNRIKRFPIAALGTEGVMRLDGRRNRRYWMHQARERAKLLGFVGYEILKSTGDYGYFPAEVIHSYTEV